MKLLGQLTKGQRAEWIVWMLFIGVLLFAMYVHEPWFDEIQAWFIAQDAPWKDLLFVLPHYEGHPPFFHLLLAIPARLGISGTLGLPLVGALFSIASAYLIIFKSPFPRVARLTLPFSYFLFYQYSVIVRPYNILVFLMCLLAVYFPQKDKRPGLFVGLLAALCACHLYGIAIAGGIALAWLWEMKGPRTWKTYFCNLGRDRRFHWLLGLLGWAILLLVWIFPRPDTFAMGSEFQTTPLWQRLIYLLFIMPADAFITDIFFVDQRLSVFPLGNWLPLLSGVLVGLCVWGSLFVCLSKKARPFLYATYLGMSLILAYYMSQHHIGLAAVLLLFILWIGWKTPSKCPVYLKAFYALLLFVPLGWTSATLFSEATQPQLSGKPLVDFLQTHQLQDKRIFITWWQVKPQDIPDTHKAVYPNGLTNTHYLPLATTLNFYAPRNLFANFNTATPYRYNMHQARTQAQDEQTLQAWNQGPLPDLFIGTDQLNTILQDRPEEKQNYAIVFRIEGHKKWKFDKTSKMFLPVYARLELLEPHHLAPQDTLFFYLKLIQG